MSLGLRMRVFQGSHLSSEYGRAGRIKEQAVVDHTALGRIADPDDIAKAALFLVSDDARCITGETLVADCGLVAGYQGI